DRVGISRRQRHGDRPQVERNDLDITAMGEDDAKILERVAANAILEDGLHRADERSYFMRKLGFDHLLAMELLDEPPIGLVRRRGVFEGHRESVRGGRRV